MNLSTQDILAIATVILPILIPLGQALYKHLVDRLPSNQRQAVVDTVRVASHAMAADPTIAQDATTAATAILKELHLPASPTFVKSLVAIFSQDAAAPDGTASQAHTDGAQPAAFPSVGFVPPVTQPTGPNLHR